MTQSGKLGVMALMAVLAWGAPMVVANAKSAADKAAKADKAGKAGKIKIKKEAKPPKPIEQPVPGSVLTASEIALDCKKMAGRMQVRILEHRGGGPSRGSSSIAQGLQSAVVPMFGGSQRGADAATDRADDIAKIKAMNAILISKNCPHYDIDAELAKDAKAPSPRLVKASGPKPQKPAKAKTPARKDQPPASKAATTAPPKT